MVRFTRFLSLATLAITLLPAVAAAKGPPWISIELPANPYDRTSKGAFLLVHAFHHGTPVGFPVSGVAEGLVNGQRKTVNLTLEPTSRTGVYALRNQWGGDGEWTLVITVRQGGENDIAQAMVKISAGEVMAVQVPTQTNADGYQVPRRISQAEIETSLRDRAIRVAAQRPG